MDSELSCAFHLQCTLHPKARSCFCILHHRIVARALLNSALPADQATKFFATLASQSDVVFHPPELKYIITLRMLHAIHVRYITRVVNVKFATIKSANTIAFMLAIRDAKTDTVILTTAVNYNSLLLANLEARVQAHQEANSTAKELARYHRIAYFG